MDTDQDDPRETRLHGQPISRQRWLLSSLISQSTVVSSAHIMCLRVNSCTCMRIPQRQGQAFLSGSPASLQCQAERWHKVSSTKANVCLINCLSKKESMPSPWPAKELENSHYPFSSQTILPHLVKESFQWEQGLHREKFLASDQWPAVNQPTATYSA